MVRLFAWVAAQTPLSPLQTNSTVFPIELKKMSASWSSCLKKKLKSKTELNELGQLRREITKQKFQKNKIPIKRVKRLEMQQKKSGPSVQVHVIR